MSKEAFVANPCLVCPGSCCREFRIYLYPRDLVLLSDSLGVPPESFTMPVPLAAGNADYAPFSFSLGEEERFILGLKRTSRGCLFLLKIGTVYRCGVHPLRPMICRSYPFSVASGNPLLIRQTICTTPWRLPPPQIKAWQILGKEMARAALRYQGFLETWHEDLLPRLEAESVPKKAFRTRFRRFLEWIREADRETGPAE